MERSGKTARSALLLTTISILTKPLGFLKEIIIASYFGASFYKDAFLIAWAIPNIVASFMSEGLNQVFVPMFIEKKHHNKEDEAWKVTSIISNIILLVSLFLIILVIIFAHSIVDLMVPNIILQTKLLAVKLLRILSCSILFLIFASLLTSILNAYRRFVFPAISFGVMNLVIIIFIVIFYESLGVYSLVFGTLFGVIGMVLIQIPRLVDIARYRFSLNIFNKDVQSFGRLMSPMVFATFLFGLLSVIEKFFASELPTGSISSLDYAFRIINFITSIFIVAITTAAFPSISTFVLEKTKDKFVMGVWDTLRMIEFFIIPISCFLIVFNYYVVKIIFERGAFVSEATIVCSQVLRVYAFGLFVYAGVWVLFHAFFAAKDTGVRTKTAMLILIVYLLCNLLLIKHLAIISLPLSHVLAYVFGMGFLVFLFLIKFGHYGFYSFLVSIFKMIISSLISVYCAWLVWNKSITLSLPEPLVFVAMFLFYILLYFIIMVVFFRDQTVLSHISSGFKKKVANYEG